MLVIRENDAFAKKMIVLSFEKWTKVGLEDSQMYKYSPIIE